MALRPSALQRAVRDLDPAYFALVMATGIVSQAMRLDGAGALSGALLAAGIAAYLILAAASAWRFAAHRKGFLADAADPGRSFAFYTFVAASDVLAVGVTATGQSLAAAALLAAGGAGWLLLIWTMPLVLAAWRGSPPALAKADGSWFLLVVGTQSIAVAVTAVSPTGAATRAIAAVCWAAGVVLYLLTAAVVTVSLLQYPRRPEDITPPYWIFTGATAISVLAGAQILRLPPDPFIAGVRGAVSGVSVVLWAFGTWLIPLLLAAGVWRHLLRGVPLRYEPALWSIVFPLGMDAVASRELGRAVRVGWLVTWGGVEAWVAFAVWLAVCLALLSALASGRHRPLRAIRRASRG